MKYTRFVIKSIIFFTLLLILLSSMIACTLSTNQPPRISKLKATNLYVYPTGTTELQCIASDPEGDTIDFKWSSDNGSFTGSGPVVTWKAPNEYGDSHIMVIVDGKGTKKEIDVRVAALRTQLRETTSKFDKEKIEAECKDGILKIGHTFEIS